MHHTASKYYPGIILFIISLMIGLLCFKDYGVPWDEPIQRDIGLVSYSYIFKGDNTLLNYPDKDHGVGFELPVVFIEKALHLTDSRDIYLMRHIVTYTFFLIGVFVGYVLMLRVFKKQALACLGFILIAFHPRLFAHAFFNSKDIPFLAVGMMIMALSQRAFEKNKLSGYLFLGILCGYVTSIRILGVLFAATILLFLAIDLINARSVKGVLAAGIKRISVFLTGCCIVLYAAWPTLWGAPVSNFIQAYKSLSHFRWEGQLLFNGHFYDAAHIPLSYIPIWFGMTVPVLWLVLGVTGMLVAIVWFIKSPRQYLQNTPERNFVLYGIFFSVPILMVVFLHAVVYDDWRHLYFIYPAFVMFVLLAVNKLSETRGRYIVWVLCLSQVIDTSMFMLGAHPHEYVYFNRLSSGEKEYQRKHYELDYWGCSFKQALEYIAVHDSSRHIKISWAANMLGNNLSILPKDMRNRFEEAESADSADYMITTFRMHPKDFNKGKLYYDIRIMNNAILQVYKMQ